MKRHPFLNYDPQSAGPQYLEDLATGYWYSETLFTAVETGIFTLLDPEGKTPQEISETLGFSPGGVERFMTTLAVLGLVTSHGPRYFNTRVSSDYLVAGKERYQGDSILWRKELLSPWSGLRNCIEAGGRVTGVPERDDRLKLADRIRRYIRAMDCIARAKVGEILPLFGDVSLKGEMLDVGAGSGAVTAGFLDHAPSLKATLMDIPEVLDHTKGMLCRRGLDERVDYCPANVLDPWPLEQSRFDLVILSNIIHAYSEKELPHILASAAACLAPEGYLVIHDFFLEHRPEKAALFDLNMFINTYNGRVFSYETVLEELVQLRLFDSGLIPLATDTALVIASKDEKALSRLLLDPRSRLISKIRMMGFPGVTAIPAGSVHIPDWAGIRCRFGCVHYGKPHCPPYAPSPGQTREFLKDYSWALLLEGEPPTAEFQRRVLRAEKEAFREGFYKAFAYWAGPCSLCASCADDGTCRNRRDSRPSMEGAGIDVYETAKRAGLSLRTLDEKSDFVKYFGLLLLE